MGQPPPCWSQHSLSFLPDEWHTGPSEMGARPVLSLRLYTSFKPPWEMKTALETLRTPGSALTHPIPVKFTLSNCSASSGVMWQTRKQQRPDPRSIRTPVNLPRSSPSYAPGDVNCVQEFYLSRHSFSSYASRKECTCKIIHSPVQSELWGGRLGAAVCQTEQENAGTP